MLFRNLSGTGLAGAHIFAALFLSFTNPASGVERIQLPSTSIFFNSNRSGSNQVFQIPIQGGSPQQITFHSEGSFLEDVHPSKDFILVSGRRDHAGRRPSRLLEKATNPGRDERLLFNADARGGRYSPDGTKVLFLRAELL